MKNKLLSISRNSIPYIKELRKINLIKSASMAILWQQMDYWFSRSPDGFYKFLSPCTNNNLYKDGDSWLEEIGFSIGEFRTAFDAMAVRYISKREYESQTDKFRGKLFCSYFNKIEGTTHYFRNHELADKLLDDLVAGNYERFSVDLPENENSPRRLGIAIYGTGDCESLSTQVSIHNPDVYSETTTTHTQTREGLENEKPDDQSNIPVKARPDENHPPSSAAPPSTRLTMAECDDLIAAACSSRKSHQITEAAQRCLYNNPHDLQTYLQIISQSVKYNLDLIPMALAVDECAVLPKELQAIVDEMLDEGITAFATSRQPTIGHNWLSFFGNLKKYARWYKPVKPETSFYSSNNFSKENNNGVKKNPTGTKPFDYAALAEEQRLDEEWRKNHANG